MINDLQQEYEDIEEFEAYYVLEIKVEKYHSIGDLEGLDEDEVKKIAYMQSVQEAVHEYIYQFTIAQQTQQKLCEIAYTAFITTISTAITLPVGIATGAMKAGTQIVSKSVGELSKIAFGSLVGLYIARAIVFEVFQEVFLDPWIEATITNFVADVGFGIFWQTLASGLAEGSRETGLGTVFNAFRASSTDPNLQSQQIHEQEQLDPQLASDLETELLQQHYEQEFSVSLKSFATSSVMLFGGAILGMFLPGIGSALGAGLTAMVVVCQTDESINIKKGLSRMVDGIRSRKTPFTHSMYLSSEEWNSLDDLSKESDLSKISNELKQGPFDNSIIAQLARDQNLPLHLVGDFLPINEKADKIVVAWTDFVNYIKECLKYNEEVLAIQLKGKSRISQRISKYLFGTQSYLQSTWDNTINYKGKSFIRRGNQFISRERLFEIFTALKQKSETFGKLWIGVYKRFTTFWAVRFDGEQFKEYRDSIEHSTVREALYEGLRDIFAKFLKLNRIQVEPAFILRLLAPYLQGKSARDARLSDSSTIQISLMLRYICEIRSLDSERILDSARQKGSGPLIRLDEERIKGLDYPKLRSELENYLIEFCLDDKSGFIISENFRAKFLFDLEVFYAIYKNIAIEDLSKVTFSSIQSEMRKFGILTEDDNYVSKYGTFENPIYSWPSLMTIMNYLRNKVKTHRISMSDYIRVLQAARVFCKETGMTYSTREGVGWRKARLTYSQFKVDKLRGHVDSILNKFFNYLYKVEKIGKGNFLNSFYAAVKKCSESFAISDFSNAPYSKNLGFTKEDRQGYIDKFERSVRLKLKVSSLDQLIKFASHQKDDLFVISDSRLLELINPSEFNTQQHPSHEYVQDLALKYIDSIIATEVPIWTQIEGKVYAGHIDFVQIEGNKIRIIDYKPDLLIDTENVGKHFINSVPQVAVYAIVFDKIFGISTSGYDIECITFNKGGYYIYDPYEALESSVKFYWDSIRDLPDWSALLSDAVINRIKS